MENKLLFLLKNNFAECSKISKNINHYQDSIFQMGNTIKWQQRKNSHLQFLHAYFVKNKHDLPPGWIYLYTHTESNFFFSPVLIAKCL